MTACHESLIQDLDGTPAGCTVTEDGDSAPVSSCVTRVTRPIVWPCGVAATTAASTSAELAR